MSILCQYSKTCPSRLAEGDTEDGCDKTDELFNCLVARNLKVHYPMAHIERWLTRRDFQAVLMVSDV